MQRQDSPLYIFHASNIFDFRPSYVVPFFCREFYDIMIKCREYYISPSLILSFVLQHQMFVRFITWISFVLRFPLFTVYVSFWRLNRYILERYNNLASKMVHTVPENIWEEKRHSFPAADSVPQAFRHTLMRNFDPIL